ncbi:ATP-binding protein [Thioalkalivibrio sp. ALE28]|uniref:PAS domain-containing sensor histidine kinase n=1 Tax=Thioalkalivibrio sp. ALE28 TaxID=1158179 RepID=UPI00035E4B03|nr:ATP-binding protein [Thioalkalivibrio sp. ALE28]
MSTREADWPTVLGDVARTLALAHPSPELQPLPRICMRIGQVMGADRLLIVERARHGSGAILRVVAQWESLQASSAPAIGPERYCVLPDLASRLARGEGYVHESRRAPAEPMPGLDASVERVMAGRFARSVLISPLLAEGCLVGSLIAESVRAEKNMGQEQLDALAPVSDVLAAFLRLSAASVALRDERQRWQDAETANDLGHWEWCPLTNTLIWSRGTRRLVPLPDGQTGTLETLCGCFSHRDSERLERMIHDVDATGQAAQLDLQVPTPESLDGFRWFRVRAWYAAPEKGQRVVRGTLTEITETHRKTTEARQATRRLENLINCAPMAVYVCRFGSEDLELEYVSESFQRVLGRIEKNFPESRALAARVHPADLHVIRDRLSTLAESGHFSAIYRLRDENGTYRWVFEDANRTGGDADVTDEVVGIFLDVTQHKQVEAEVYASQRRYKAIVDDAPSFICRYGTNFRLKFANQAFVETFGQGSHSVEGRDWLSFLPEEERSRVGERIARLSPRQPVQEYEMRVQVPGRGARWITWAERGFFSTEGDLLEVQVVGHDHTDLKEAQEKLIHAAKMGTIGEMATGMAHELNQPLNVVRMAAFNARRHIEEGTPAADALLGKLDRIEDQVSRASSIIDQMRMFGRKSAPEPGLFSVTEAARNSQILIREQLECEGIDVRMISAGTGSEQVLGHRDQLEQVLMNLMINSRDAIREKRSAADESGQCNPEACDDRIELSVAPCTGEGLVELVVEDSGGGVEPDRMDQVFEPFFTTKEVGKGTGLGLSVSFGIVKDMGGTIEVENTPQGARFRIRLPVATRVGGTRAV